MGSLLPQSEVCDGASVVCGPPAVVYCLTGMVLQRARELVWFYVLQLHPLHNHLLCGLRSESGEGTDIALANELSATVIKSCTFHFTQYCSKVFYNRKQSVIYFKKSY